MLKGLQQFILSLIVLFIFSTGAGYIIAGYLGIAFTYTFSYVIMGSLLVGSMIAGMLAATIVK